MPSHIPLINRIQLDEKTGCWNWRGARDPNGYGKAFYRGKTLHAHRLSAHLWLRFPLKSKKFICHRCDNKACFNPKHLFIGTALENMRDCVKKGRYISGYGLHMSRRTHCKNGHEFDEKNTAIRPQGGRRCRRCGVVSSTKHYRKIQKERHNAKGKK